MENMKIYNATREVPKEAQKPIQFGGMKGKTDINPMWRIRALTEQFGPCGFGWYTEILEERLEPLPDGRIAAFVKINLFVIVDGKASMPIAGTGGNMYVKKTKNGLEVNDECFKMAYTDAISVACKCLGFGANIYWSSDKTKYDVEDEKPTPKKAPYKLANNWIQSVQITAKECNYTGDAAKKLIKDKYNKTSSTLLTVDQAKDFVTYMKANKLEVAK